MFCPISVFHSFAIYFFFVLPSYFNAFPLIAFLCLPFVSIPKLFRIFFFFSFFYSLRFHYLFVYNFWHYLWAHQRVTNKVNCIFKKQFTNWRNKQGKKYGLKSSLNKIIPFSRNRGLKVNKANVKKKKQIVEKRTSANSKFQFIFWYRKCLIPCNVRKFFYFFFFIIIIIRKASNPNLRLNQNNPIIRSVK